jgi:hypothetical protein
MLTFGIPADNGGQSPRPGAHEMGRDGRARRRATASTRATARGGSRRRLRSSSPRRRAPSRRCLSTNGSSLSVDDRGRAGRHDRDGAQRTQVLVRGSGALRRPSCVVDPCATRSSRSPRSRWPATSPASWTPIRGARRPGLSRRTTRARTPTPGDRRRLPRARAAARHGRRVGPRLRARRHSELGHRRSRRVPT